MSRMLKYAGAGFGVGFLILFVIFNLCVPDGNRKEGISFSFSIMGAVPAAAMCALFGAVQILQDEMRETRRQMKHWQSLFQIDNDHEKPSTQFKIGLPSDRSGSDPASFPS
jgi:hypothetical protein